MSLRVVSWIKYFLFPVSFLQEADLIRPKALRSGDLIGIAAPASPADADTVAAGVRLLEARGYRVALGKSVLDAALHCGYLAGSDADRAADLDRLFAHREVKAIFCVRGGYGAMRLLDLLDWSAIRANPKIFVGYSDVTSLHLALARRCGLVTFHGPMLTTLAKCDAAAQSVFWRILEVMEPFGEYPVASENLQTVVGGMVEGELAGGCLTLLASACGTPDAPDFTDKLVLIEDVGEAVYRADRCLTQLKNAGLLQSAAGFVIGEITGWQKQEARPEINTPDSLWRDTFTPLNRPALFGFPFGHAPNPLTLPLGIRARLDAQSRTLTLLEACLAT